MNTDGHYYGILAFCRACGFKKESAVRIAYASQYVDDARINHITIKGNPGNIQCDVINGRPSFFNMATSHSYEWVKNLNYCFMTGSMCAFHFVPGCRGESFTKKLRCSKDSPVMVDILDETLRQDDPVRLGMVLHPFADTFCHQGFSGILSKVNDIKEVTVLSKIPWVWIDRVTDFIKNITKDNYDRLFDFVMPAYGHAQASIYPDLPYLTWSYKYDYTDEFSEALKLTVINNRMRFEEAFRSITAYLYRYLQRYPGHRDMGVRFKDFKILYDTLLSEGTDDTRVMNWRKVLVSEGLFKEDELDGIAYDRDRWLREAFSNYNRDKFHHVRVEDAELADNFADSGWYKFYLSVKWYRERFFQSCSKNGLVIPR